MVSLTFFRLTGLWFTLTVTNAEMSRPVCPNLDSYVYIPHVMPCYFYACYQGNVMSDSPYKCPSESKYYDLLEESGLKNPCSSCPYSPKTTASVSKSTTQVVKTNPTAQAPTGDSTSPATVITPKVTQPAKKDITMVRSNAHVHGAVWAADNTTIRQCLQLCEDESHCFGFDFDSSTASCWTHDENTICSPAESKDNCTHFRLYDGCPMYPDETTTSMAMTTRKSSQVYASTSNPGHPYMVTFIGWHIRGGTEIPLATGTATPEICTAICRLDRDCAGVDFDEISKSCWVHGVDTECTQLEPKLNCAHFRITNICDDSSSISMTTKSPASSASVSDTSDTSIQGMTTLGLTIPTTYKSNTDNNPDSNAVPSGFFEFVEGYHIPGGLRLFSGVSLRQCLDSCLTTPYCLALDYDAINESCYFHMQDTYCRKAYELHGNYHFKRLPCINGVANDAVATWYHFHVELGRELCTGCTLGFCMESCYIDTNCAGLDFDIRNLGCYLFKSTDVCGPLIPKDYCLHMSRDACVPDVLIGLPLDSLVILVYPPPVSLPSGWQAYPGVRVRNGVQAGSYHVGPEQCIGYCHDDNTCLSGDYDMSDGSCWLHLSAHKQCAQVEVSDTVYHFKKQPCDVVHGTRQAYLGPVWTA